VSYPTAINQHAGKRHKVFQSGILVNLALFIISIVIAVIMGEMTLRLIGRGPLYVSPERDRFWKYDALLGWSHLPGQEGIFETAQFRTTVKINQKGLRDRDHSYKRTFDAQRILIVGDSFAWGYGVEETQRFSQDLERSMNVEVINAGVSGYSTDQELLWLKNEGIKYDPDLVILVFAGNDIGDNHQQLVNTIYYKPQFVIEDGHLVLTNYPVPKNSSQGKFMYYLSQRSALFYFLVQRYFDLRSVYSKFIANPRAPISSTTAISTKKESFKLTTTLIHEIYHVAESTGAKLMIVTTDRWWNWPSSESYQDFIEVLHSEGFSVLDVESMRGFDPERMLIPNDGHWSPDGHKFVATKVREFIEANQLLNRPQN